MHFLPFAKKRAKKTHFCRICRNQPTLANRTCKSAASWLRLQVLVQYSYDEVTRKSNKNKKKTWKCSSVRCCRPVRHAGSAVSMPSSFVRMETAGGIARGRAFAAIDVSREALKQLPFGYLFIFCFFSPHPA